MRRRGWGVSRALCPQGMTRLFLIEPYAFVFPLWTRPLLAGRAFLHKDGGDVILCFGPLLKAASTARSNRDHADSSAASWPSDLAVLVMTRNPHKQPTPPPSDIPIPGQCKRSVAHLFMISRPPKGWRHIDVADRHAAVDDLNAPKDLSHAFSGERRGAF